MKVFLAKIKKLLEDNLLSKLNVNISTKIIDFMMNNNTYNEIFSGDVSLTEKLMQNLINLTNENKTITKLVKKLLNFIPKLFLIVQKKIQILTLLR